MNKENIEVIYTLLIVRILIFSILKCNVCELEQSLIKRASFKKKGSLKIVGLLVGALSVCKWFKLFRTASFSCLMLLQRLTIKLHNSKTHWPGFHYRLSGFPAPSGMGWDRSASHSREENSVNSEQNFSPEKCFFKKIQWIWASSSRKGPWEDLLSNLNVFTIHTLLSTSCHCELQTSFQWYCLAPLCLFVNIKQL